MLFGPWNCCPAGVLMGGALDRFVLPLVVDAWIDRLRRHGR
jgi:hypothetical protein